MNPGDAKKRKNKELYMSVPPSSRRPSSTPPSKGTPEQDKEPTKKFHLPGKKEHVKEKDEGEEKLMSKKKGLFDLTGQEANIQAKQQQLHQQDVEAAGAKASDISAVEAQAQVSQVSKIIQDMVAGMRVGQVEGQDFASMQLKQSAEVPPAFAGSNLTLSFQENGLTIRFDNFMTPQQQNTAINLVEQNKDQLQQMVQALNAKNIQVAELSIGTHTVAIPRVEPLPPPFQPPPAAGAETRQQQERGGGEEGPGGGPGEEGGRR
jgi:hypothetical protein